MENLFSLTGNCELGCYLAELAAALWHSVGGGLYFGGEKGFLAVEDFWWWLYVQVMVEVNGSVVVVGGVDPASGSTGQLQTEILREGGNRSGQKIS